jgi:hypothetical protein
VRISRVARTLLATLQRLPLTVLQHYIANPSVTTQAGPGHTSSDVVVMLVHLECCGQSADVQWGGKSLSELKKLAVEVEYKPHLRALPVACGLPVSR